jgi:uncharacterized DUF497 family protein
MDAVSYEWDPAKGDENLAKHGVDFESAANFDWVVAIITPDTRRNYGEARFVAHGPIDGRLYVLVYTRRHPFRRIISLRKANKREQAEYTVAILARLARGRA